MHPMDDLLRCFQELASRKGSVRLLNAYRGIPVIHPAEVLSVNQGHRPAQVQIIVELHPHQAVCMSLEGKTCLIGAGLAQALQARVVGVDMLRSQAILAEFSPANSSIGKRLAVRIQPKTPLEAQIFDGEHRLACKVNDLSYSGVGVTDVCPIGHPQINLAKGQLLFLELRLPASNGMLHLRVKISNLESSPETPFQRLGMTIFPEMPADELLRAYIATRQVETLAELQLAYETLCRKQGSL